ncbi:hypothetical protein GC175_01415 [bacterium]|nr:hypothetical protein [bacterium]
MTQTLVSPELVDRLAQAIGARLYPHSIAQDQDVVYAMVNVDAERYLAIFVPEGVGAPTEFEGESTQVEDEGTWTLLRCPRTPANINALRARFEWLRPVPLGTQTSFGFGDRIGLATSGHVQSARGAGVAPIFTQQSVRENTRIGRTPQQVMDDATWGVFQEGWRLPWGADADHVKVVESLPDFVAAGYTFYTIDPSDHVDNDAESDDVVTLRKKVAALPLDQLSITATELADLYAGQTVNLGDKSLVFSQEKMLRAAAKYGRAIAHARTVASALTAQMGGRPFELEFSVDETDTPTSPHEHYYIAAELHRLNIPVVSLAPRFVGKFEKGIDYIGDLDEFSAALAWDIAIMKHFGDYKISVHTGSDKFSIYPIVAHAAQGRVHVKTAGTSYLEALRVIAAEDVAFFREILDFSRDHFEKDRKSYYLSCDASKVHPANSYSDAELVDLLNQVDSRQVLHVTFGSVLDHYGDRLKTFLRNHEAAYEAVLVTHFGKHLAPLAA